MVSVYAQSTLLSWMLPLVLITALAGSVSAQAPFGTNSPDLCCVPGFFCSPTACGMKRCPCLSAPGCYAEWTTERQITKRGRGKALKQKIAPQLRVVPKRWVD